MITHFRTCGLGLWIACAAVHSAAGAEVTVSTADQAAAAIALCRPGDVVVVRDGSYQDWRVELAATGSADRPIIFRPETPGGVTLGGSVAWKITGAFLTVEGFSFHQAQSTRHESIVEFRAADHCRLTECSFVNCGDPESTFTRTINLAYGSHHCRVDHCFMTGTLSMGMGVVVRESESGQGNTDNRFDHNYFRDIRRRSSNGQEPIQLGQDQTAFGHVSVRAIIEKNLFEDASGDGEIISNKSADNIIRCNTMRNSKAGICLRGGQNVLVEANYCYRTFGIRVFGNSHTIINNYLEETDDGIRLDAGQYRAGQFLDRDRSGSYEAASRIVIAHNTIVNPREAGIRLGALRDTEHGGVVRNEMPSQIHVVNNLVAGTRGTLFEDMGCHELQWQSNLSWPQLRANTGLVCEGIILQDPHWLPREDGMAHLASDSPAKDAGTVLENVKFDYTGAARDAAPDIGCQEVGPPGKNRPLQPGDVGPAWMDRNLDPTR